MKLNRRPLHHPPSLAVCQADYDKIKAMTVEPSPSEANYPEDWKAVLAYEQKWRERGVEP